MKKESFKASVNFLRQVYSESISDVANIIVADADEDVNTIAEYLTSVKNFTDKLLNDLK